MTGGRIDPGAGTCILMMKVMSPCMLGWGASASDLIFGSPFPGVFFPSSFIVRNAVIDWENIPGIPELETSTSSHFPAAGDLLLHSSL